MLILRALSPLFLLIGFTAGADLAFDRVEGQRVCLSNEVAARSAELTRMMCQTITTEAVAFPRTDLNGLAARVQGLW